MQLKGSKIYIPVLICAAISITFWVVQFFVFDVIGRNYSMCHVLFGLAGPLIFSYFSFSRTSLQLPNLRLVLRTIRAIPLRSWPLSLLSWLKRSTNRDFNEGVAWTPWVGVAITLYFSVRNEVFEDPASNGIPFTEAYHHFLADLVGMVTFLLVTWAIVRTAHSPESKGLKASGAGN